MKVGILTLYYNNRNMGGQLQAFALTNVLRKYCLSDCSELDILSGIQKNKRISAVMPSTIKSPI